MVAIAMFAPFAVLDDLVSAGVLLCFAITNSCAIVIRRCVCFPLVYPVGACRNGSDGGSMKTCLPPAFSLGGLSSVFFSSCDTGGYVKCVQEGVGCRQNAQDGSTRSPHTDTRVFSHDLRCFCCFAPPPPPVVNGLPATYGMQNI